VRPVIVDEIPALPDEQLLLVDGGEVSLFSKTIIAHKHMFEWKGVLHLFGITLNHQVKMFSITPVPGSFFVHITSQLWR